MNAIIIIIYSKSAYTIAGEFLFADTNALLEGEQHEQESVTGDLDLLLGLNNQEGGMILVWVTFAQMPTETLTSPAFFVQMMNNCFLLNGFNKNAVMAKVRLCVWC